MTETAAKRSFGSVVREYFTYAKNGVKYFVKNDSQLIWAFILPAVILFISYALFGVWPFGKESVLSLDLNGQYVYYYDHMYDVLYGDESVFYSWSRNLSGEFMGIIGYYLASPFNFIVWLFPREAITEGLLTMMVLKVGAIGFCMGVYLTYAKKCNKLTTVIFSVCYALCAYTVVQTMNPMWLDGVMILPIICLGLERYVDYGRFRLLAFSLVYGFVTCFYIGFMLAIFSVLYFVYYAVATENSSAREHLLSRFLGFGAIGIIAAMCSCFMILPVYESLSLGKFEFSTPDYSLANNFELIELADKLLPNSYDTVRMAGLPFIYCGVITVLMLPAYFFMKKYSGRERLASAILILTLVICMYIRPVDMMWHGGQLPNWLPYRYSFMLSFLFCMMAAKAFNDLKHVSRRTITVSALAWFVLMIWQESIDHVDTSIKKSPDTLSDFETILPSMLILVIISAMIVQLKDRFNVNFKKTAPVVFSVLLIATVCSETLFSTTMQIYAQDADIVYSDRDTYADVIPKIRDTVEEIKENDDGFYRIEKLFFRTVNDPMALNMYGLSHSSSTLNAAPIDLLKRLGFTARSHYTRYSGATMITSSIFGVKYELSTESNSTNDVKKDGEITVTENPLALPICYLADDNITDLELTENNPFIAQNELLSALAGMDYTEFFKKITVPDPEMVNLTKGGTTDDHISYKKSNTSSEATLTFRVTMTEAGDLYMYLPSKYERKVELTVNGISKDSYFEGDNNYLRNLGTFEAGEEVTVKLKLTLNEVYFREALFYTLDETAAENALNAVGTMNADTVCEQISTTEIKITVNAADQQLLFTTIPVEKGWKAYVDGVETELVTTVNSLYAVPVTAGQHTVELKFTTASYPVALVITAVGIAILVILIIFWRKKHKNELEASRAHRKAICDGSARQAIIDADKAAYEAYLAEKESEEDDEQDHDNDESDREMKPFAELADDETVPLEKEDEDWNEEDGDFYEGLNFEENDAEEKED